MRSTIKWMGILVAAMGASFAAGYGWHRPGTVYVDVPMTVTDTLYVQVDKIVYKHLPAVHDTVYEDLIITEHDTLYGPLDVAHTDAVLEADGVKYGRLEMAYYLPPADWFDLDFKPEPLPTIVQTKYIYKDVPWYKHPAITAAAGLVIGAAVMQATQ